ncbi:MAG: hypothetical protein CSA84_00105 [Actinomycetales bacterium]|nr:MAG: hypothetical protein CSA84_00105 [Actinomycetales bacterium]
MPRQPAAAGGSSRSRRPGDPGLARLGELSRATESLVLSLDPVVGDARTQQLTDQLVEAAAAALHAVAECATPGGPPGWSDHDRPRIAHRHSSARW